jgi:hypothetical protein
MYHDRVVGRGREHFRGSPADQRVHDAVQALALGFVVEHHRGQLRPVQRAVRSENLLAERLDQLGKPGRAGFDDLTGELVRVDQHRAVFGQPTGHSRLARTNPAGESHAQHDVDTSVAWPGSLSPCWVIKLFLVVAPERREYWLSLGVSAPPPGTI